MDQGAGDRHALHLAAGKLAWPARRPVAEADCLQQLLRRVIGRPTVPPLQPERQGDILMAHLGIWSRQDPWAPAVLAPLVDGLQARGFCFKTLREHPDFQPWIAAHGG